MSRQSLPGGYLVSLFPRARRSLVAPAPAPTQARVVELLEELVATAGRIEQVLSTPPKEKRLLDQDEAAFAIGVSTRTFQRHVAPDLGRVTVGTRVFFPVTEIDNWIDARTRWPSKAR